jgi:hypothetical protein
LCAAPAGGLHDRDLLSSFRRSKQHRAPQCSAVQGGIANLIDFICCGRVPDTNWSRARGSIRPRIYQHSTKEKTLQFDATPDSGIPEHSQAGKLHTLAMPRS